MATSKTEILLVLSLLAAPAGAVEKIGVTGSENTFDATIQKTIGGRSVTLELTGTALREKLWINVYAIGSYVEKGHPARTAEQLAGADVPKTLHLILERDVDGASIGEALTASITANHPQGFEAELKQLNQYFAGNPVKKDDHVWLTHLPGKGVAFQVGAQNEFVISSPQFARAVWDIYFGKKNLGVAIKNGLSSRL